MVDGRAPLGKMDIVHHLMKRFGYRRYLEIATATTGLCHAEIDRDSLAVCRRLLYNLPPNFSDGLPIDYAFSGLDIAAGLAALSAERPRFDIIFVDPFHAYAPSRRDIESAFAMLDPGGALVVHDCRPADAALADPQFQVGEWCGVTYKAYLDVVLGRTDLRYLTVDTDYGCGVIRKKAMPLRRRIAAALGLDPDRNIVREWRSFGDDYAAAWRHFDANVAPLLRLVTPAAFLSEGGLDPLR
jgi:hypothetical protein